MNEGGCCLRECTSNVSKGGVIFVDISLSNETKKYSICVLINNLLETWKTSFLRQFKNNAWTCSSSQRIKKLARYSS